MVLRLDDQPLLFLGQVMHQRLLPKFNGFSYPTFYLNLPLQLLPKLAIENTITIDKFARLSFYNIDHGPHKDKVNLEQWSFEQLNKFGLGKNIERISLVTMPRMVGYVFNPVSFWLCFDDQGLIRALIYEVNNTYGETHCYLCAHENESVINEKDWLVARKEFHVSPFLPREGYYKFRVSFKENKLSLWINYYNADGLLVLLTSLKGELSALNPESLNRAFWRYPLITFQAMTRIYWQALRLKIKGLKFISLPKQKEKRISKNTQISEGNSLIKTHYCQTPKITKM